jgi:hypothetical protein
MSLDLESVQTVVEREIAGDSYDRIAFEQTFEGHGITLTRIMDIDGDADDALVLRLEGRVFGMPVSNRRGLHLLAQRYVGHHRMVVIDNGRDQCLFVMAQIEKPLRRLLNARENTSEVAS